MLVLHYIFMVDTHDYFVNLLDEEQRRRRRKRRNLQIVAIESCFQTQISVYVNYTLSKVDVLFVLFHLIYSLFFRIVNYTLI